MPITSTPQLAPPTTDLHFSMPIDLHFSMPLDNTHLTPLTCPSARCFVNAFEARLHSNRNFVSLGAVNDTPGGISVPCL